VVYGVGCGAVRLRAEFLVPSMSIDTDTGFQEPLTIRTARIVDTVTDYLRNLILDHKLVPGTVLLQTEWAEKLGVSRTPLREAFRLLENDGLVRISNGNRTIEVVQYTADDLRDLYELREMIDGLAARLLATHRAPSVVLAEMAGLLDAMEGASDPFRSSAWFAAHTGFHVCIATHCGNKRVQALLSVIRSTSMALHTPMVKHDEDDADDLTHILEVSRYQHQSIYDAICAGQADKAERAARRHITSTLRSDLIRRATRTAPDAREQPAAVRR
jgi:GntR family transcriptional regulator, vanillate catabolism transcriptional regulator